MPPKKLKPIPRFESEDDEREFWATHSTADYIDWGRARRVRFPDLERSTKTISLRLPESLLADLRALADQRDVPYQSLLKTFLYERVREEHRAEAEAVRSRARRVAEPSEAYEETAETVKTPRRKSARRE
jgi:predicted DNA binding CopG/RHH family protein